jgi:maltose O-acetyltransferase
VSIGHNVKIYTSSFDTETLIVSGVKKNKCGNVTIGSNVLIGANVFICPGVTIGDNSVIGANSVVSSNVLPNSVYAGCPAKLLKSYDN